MEFSDFYDIAIYANENWNKGNFTPKEVACNADIYCSDFRWSVVNDTIAETIKSLCKNLAEDLQNMSESDADYEEVKNWLYQIASELNLIDMDCHNYLETDSWLAEFI